MMRHPHLLDLIFGVALPAVIATATAAAAADEPRADGRPRGTVVMLGELDRGAENRSVLRAVEGQLADLDVRLHVIWIEQLAPKLPQQIEAAEQVAREVGALAVFWCELEYSDRIYLYFAAPRGGRMVVRELTGSGAGGAAEALAIIVRSSVEAVLAGGEIGEVVAPVAAGGAPTNGAAQRAAPAGADRPPRSLALETSYVLGVYSAADSTEHGVALGVRVDLGRLWFFGVGYTVAFPVVTQAQGVELELRRHPVRASVGLGWRTGSVRLALSLALRVDPVSERVTARSPGVRVQGRGSEVIVSAQPAVQAGYLFGERVELFVRFGLDIPFNDVRYVIDGPAGPLVVRDDWPARPQVLAGLAVLLW